MKVFLLIIAAATVACGPVPQLEQATGSKAEAVVEGSLTPWDYDISPLEQNAVVGQLASNMGNWYQGCTGTVVGDRLIIAAGHCMVQNQPDWLNNGADPEILEVSRLRYVVGDNVDQPLCTLEVESLHVHPDINPTPLYGIEHDVCVSVLAESIFTACPHVAPLQINRDPIPQSMMGTEILQGGFGSTDGSYNFSPLRYWSILKMTRQDDYVFGTTHINKGYPTYGDSGASGLHRFDDGALRVLGVLTAGTTGTNYFLRLDNNLAFIESVASAEQICGDVDSKGICVQDTVVTCGEHGIFNTDCQKENQQCTVNSEGQAMCECPCDDAPYCQKSCACDEQCPCECDNSSECDEDCDCDQACHQDSDEDPAQCSGVGGTPHLFFALALLMMSLARRSRRI